MEKEVWKDVPGYEGLYQVSNLGNVRSLDRYYLLPGADPVFHKGKVLKPFLIASKRLHTQFNVNGVGKTFCVDGLVAEAFIRARGDGEAVYHKDGDITNCRVENLAWTTAEELRDIWRDGSRKSHRNIETMDGEEWRDVVGFEGLFKVSSYGRVASVDKVVPYRGMPSVLYGKLASVHMSNCGYMRVNLRDGGYYRTASVHRLVAEAFLPNPDNLPEVDHIDAVRHNNHVTNLRWVTREQNFNHMVEMGHLVLNRRWSDRELHRKDLKNHMIPVVRNDGKTYESLIEAARDLGYSGSAQIAAHLRGKVASCRGYTFAYASDKECKSRSEPRQGPSS